MVDTLTTRERSERMARVRGKNTKPEKLVRRLVSELGYRYRLHSPMLPGKPDIVFANQKQVIFVHGCFWHRHSAKSCKLARLPKSRQEFWESKLEQNRLRDNRIKKKLDTLGWKSITIWECQLTNLKRVSGRLKSFLEKDR